MQSDAISHLNLQPKGLNTIQLTRTTLKNKWYNRSHQTTEKKNQDYHLWVGSKYNFDTMEMFVIKYYEDTEKQAMP